MSCLDFAALSCCLCAFQGVRVSRYCAGWLAEQNTSRKDYLSALPRRIALDLEAVMLGVLRSVEAGGVRRSRLGRAFQKAENDAGIKLRFTSGDRKSTAH